MSTLKQTYCHLSFNITQKCMGLTVPNVTFCPPVAVLTSHILLLKLPSLKPPGKDRFPGIWTTKLCWVSLKIILTFWVAHGVSVNSQLDGLPVLSLSFVTTEIESEGKKCSLDFTHYTIWFFFNKFKLKSYFSEVHLIF